jgi:hypothetical protein
MCHLRPDNGRIARRKLKRYVVTFFTPLSAIGIDQPR